MSGGQVIPFRETVTAIDISRAPEGRMLIVTMYPAMFSGLGNKADVVGSAQTGYDMVSRKPYTAIFADMGGLGGTDNGFRFARVMCERTSIPVWLMADAQSVTSSNRAYSKKNSAKGLILRDAAVVLATFISPDEDLGIPDAPSQASLVEQPATSASRLITKPQLDSMTMHLRRFLGPLADDVANKELSRLVSKGMGTYENVCRGVAKSIEDTRARDKFMSLVGVEK